MKRKEEKEKAGNFALLILAGADGNRLAAYCCSGVTRELHRDTYSAFFNVALLI